MGIKTTWTCDHCGHSQEDEKSPRQMWWLTLVVHSDFGRPRYGGEEVRQMWCRECLAKWSMTKFTEKEDHPEKVEAPTFEDKLREIIRDEISHEVEGSI